MTLCESDRDFIKDIIGEEDFKEVFVNTPLAVCEERDVKGLYKKARAGEIKNFTGIDAPYESPVAPEVEIRTDQEEAAASVKRIINLLEKELEINA